MKERFHCFCEAFGKTLNIKINIQDAAIFDAISNKRWKKWDIKQVTETIAMIEEPNSDIPDYHFMGISLLDCIDTDIERAAEKIYQKI